MCLKKLQVLSSQLESSPVVPICFVLKCGKDKQKVWRILRVGRL